MVHFLVGILLRKISRQYTYVLPFLSNLIILISSATWKLQLFIMKIEKVKKSIVSIDISSGVRAKDYDTVDRYVNVCASYCRKCPAARALNEPLARHSAVINITGLL